MFHFLKITPYFIQLTGVVAVLQSLDLRGHKLELGIDFFLLAGSQPYPLPPYSGWTNSYEEPPHFSSFRVELSAS